MSRHKGEVIPTGVMSITPSDSTVLDLVGFVVTGSTGNVAVIDGYGVTTTIAVGTAGDRWALKVSKVLATGTTATGILGFLP